MQDLFVLHTHLTYITLGSFIANHTTQNAGPIRTVAGVVCPSTVGAAVTFTVLPIMAFITL